MDIILIECPHCGGQVERKEGEYFAKCPYCGKEVCFNEIKEEAQINVFKDKLNDLEQKNKVEQEHKEKLQKWLKARNAFFAVMAICNFAGFFLVGISDAEDHADDVKMMIGSVCMIIAWTLLLFVPAALGLAYPNYNILSGSPEPGGKLKEGVKLLAAGFGICAATTVIAYLAYLIFYH